MASGPVNLGGGESPNVFDASMIGWFVATFAMLVAAGLGVPIPEELPVVGAGVWVGSNPEIGRLRWLILPVCILGVVISDGLLYGIGRLWGRRLLELRWVKKLLPPEKQQRIEKNFHEYGVKILLFARILPGIRSPIFIMAGIMKLPLTRFIFADGIYAIPGVSLLFFLAWWFGDQFRDLVEKAEGEVDKVRPILILTALVAVAVYFAFHFLRRPVSTGDPEELPVIGGQVAAKLHSPEEKPPVPPEGSWTGPDGAPSKVEQPVDSSEAPPKKDA